MMLVWQQHFDAANVVWLLLTSVSVLLIYGPGFAIFYSAILHKKWLADSGLGWLTLVAVLSLGWVLWIHSLAFAVSWGSRPRDSGAPAPVPTDLQTMMRESAAAASNMPIEPGGGFVGDSDFMGVRGIAPEATIDGPMFPAWPAAKPLPHSAFLVLQMTLFITALVPLVVGLIGRLPLPGIIMFTLLWGTVVYAPSAHWLWGGGWLSRLGALDSGGGLLHVAIGASALACAIVFRRHSEQESYALAIADLSVGNTFPPAYVGVLMLWAGSLVLHPAMTFDPDGLAATALVNTHLSASAGLVAWMVADWFVGRKVNANASCSGVVAGIAASAAPSSLILPHSAVIIGIIAGILGSLTSRVLQPATIRNGVLVAFAVQGIGGAVGVLLTGVFASAAVSTGSGLIDGNVAQIGFQAAALGAVGVLSFFGTLLTLGGVAAAFRLQQTNLVSA
jgi:Amt family ammonium transporter